MITILKIIMIAIFEMLPTSPFPTMFDSVMVDSDLISTLNWFLPFDVCANMMLAWLDCILVYYAFVVVKKIVLDILVDKIISAGSGLIGAAGAAGGISGGV